MDTLLVWAYWTISSAIAGLGIYASVRPNPAGSKHLGIIVAFILAGFDFFVWEDFRILLLFYQNWVQSK